MDSDNMDELFNDDSNNLENMPSTSQVLVLNNQSFNLSEDAEESNEKNKVYSNIASNNENLTDQLSYENEDDYIDFSDDELKEYIEVGANKIEEDNHLIKQSEKECISKFLSGELSFAEYVNQMENDFLLGEEDVIPSERKVENESENFDDDINKINSTKNDFNEGRKAKKKHSKRRKLPPALKGLMGEANLRFARGDKQLATDICLEIIRQVPTAPEPYLTLAGLYEEQGHTDKSLQMSLIAAHLSPFEANWIHLAELSLELGHRNQAIICYNKALRVDYKQIYVHLKLAQLLEEDGQTSSALKNYSKLLSSLDPVESSDKILELSKMIAEKYHNEKDLNKTKETLEVAINKCPQLISSEHINLYLEVLLSLKEFSNCLEVFINFCDVAVEFEANNDEIYIVNCDLKKDLDIDIKVKLIITLIHMKYTKPLEDLVNSLLSENILEVGDLYVDVAEAYMVEELYDDALKLLNPLIACDKFSLPAVWLRYGECLKNTGDIKKSVSAYLKVIKEVPHHDDARLMAAQLLTKLGQRDEAINILEQEENSEIINPDLLYERCLLLKNKPDQVNEFLAAGQLFLSRHFIRIRSFEELRSLSNHKASSVKKKSSLNEVRMISGHLPIDQDRPNFIQGKKIPTLEEEWDLFKSMCNLCLKYNKFSLLQRLVFSAQGSDLFSPYSQDLDLMCLMASYYNRDSYLTFNYARQLVLKDINLAHPWNVLNLLVIHGDDMRHNKFIIRLLTRNPTNSILSFLHANNCLVSGTYKYALNEYAAAFRKEPSPMLAYLIGISLSQMACQKFSAKKHSLVTQALAFFSKYKELRGEACSQEYHYNIGRFYHQLGLLPSALFHYKQSLKTKPSFISEFGGIFDLSREAAYNIHLIYLQSGAHDTARMYLEKYIVI